MAIVDNFTKEELIQLVKQSKTFSELILKLGYTTTSGNNHITVKKRLDAYQIDYSNLQQFYSSPIK